MTSRAEDGTARDRRMISMVARKRDVGGLLAYKVLHPQQLRTLIEVAITGSQAAAARSLGLSQPTVWEQLHALERTLGAPLMRLRGRACILTPDGEQLVQMALPLIEDFESLKKRFQEKRQMERQTFTIVATPRVIQEDLAPCFQEFEQRHPNAVMSLLECDDDLVIGEVLDLRADLGWSPSAPNADQSRFVDIVASYDVDNYLITPRDHGLAKKRRVRPEDILKYRIVNGHGTFYGPRMQAIEAQINSSPANHSRVAAYYVFTIRMLVKHGIGVAIVPRRVSRSADPELHERNLSSELGRSIINAIQRRGARHPLIAEFAKFVIERMK